MWQSQQAHFLLFPVFFDGLLLTMNASAIILQARFQDMSIQLMEGIHLWGWYQEVPTTKTYPIFYQPEILQVISNAVRWAAPSGGPGVNFGHFPDPIEKVEAWEDQIEIEHPE